MSRRDFEQEDEIRVFANEREYEDFNAQKEYDRLQSSADRDFRFGRFYKAVGLGYVALDAMSAESNPLLTAGYTAGFWLLGEVYNRSSKKKLTKMNQIPFNFIDMEENSENPGKFMPVL